MHLAIYEARPDVQAIVHAHPATATAFSVSGEPIRCELIAESYAMVHHIARAPYALMGTADLAARVAAEARTADVVLMQNHGVVALGQTLLQAFDRLELVEAAAQMTLITRQLGAVAPLRDEWQRDLDALMGRPRPG
jgi:L-fuculose-phosphate aldolase